MADDDYEIFRAAHEGNLAPLIELLRSGAELTPDRRALVIKILEGKLKRPAHRQASVKTLERQHAIARRVHELEREGRKSLSAIVKTAREFGCSEKTVRNALRKESEREKIWARTQKALEQLCHRARTGGAERFRLQQLALEIRLMLEDTYREVGLTPPPRPFIFTEAQDFLQSQKEKK